LSLPKVKEFASILVKGPPNVLTSPEDIRSVVNLKSCPNRQLFYALWKPDISM